MCQSAVGEDGEVAAADVKVVSSGERQRPWRQPRRMLHQVGWHSEDEGDVMCWFIPYLCYPSLHKLPHKPEPDIPVPFDLCCPPPLPPAHIWCYKIYCNASVCAVCPTDTFLWDCRTVFPLGNFGGKPAQALDSLHPYDTSLLCLLVCEDRKGIIDDNLTVM